jgi:hypothetical protein
LRQTKIFRKIIIIIDFLELFVKSNFVLVKKQKITKFFCSIKPHPPHTRAVVGANKRVPLIDFFLVTSYIHFDWISNKMSFVNSKIFFLHSRFELNCTKKPLTPPKKSFCACASNNNKQTNNN